MERGLRVHTRILPTIEQMLSFFIAQLPIFSPFGRDTAGRLSAARRAAG
jgi:glycogen debranching enzyme